MKLFPLLGRSPNVDRLAKELMALSVDECRKHRALNHAEEIRSPTGGTPTTGTDLERIADGLTAIAKEFGYPAKGRDNRVSDARWGEFLHTEMNITPHEAANDAIWHFLTCVLVPDLTRWRWEIDSDGEEASDRWITVNHRGRNCFGRLWWRCEVLKRPEVGEEYNFIRELKEDEFVQLMERPWLASHRALARISVQTLLEMDKAKPISNRARFFRETQKQLLRIGAFIEFEALDEAQLRQLASDIFKRTLTAVP